MSDEVPAGRGRAGHEVEDTRGQARLGHGIADKDGVEDRFLDGLTTTVQPAASAAAYFRAAVVFGTFHGTTAATTPTGTRRTMV